MKLKIIISFFLFSSILTSIAQDAKQNIEKSFGDYYNLVAQNKIEQAVEYMPEKFFSFISKDQIIIALKSVMNNKDLDYKILDYKIKTVNDIKKIDSNYYSILSYVSNMSMRFTSIDTLSTNDKKKAQLGLLQLSLANTFGPDNVKLDDKTGTFLISSHKKSCAISTNGVSNWKFVNIEARQRLILDKILPKEITETL